MQSFGGPFHSKVPLAGTGPTECCNRRKCFYCLFIEMECMLLSFPTYAFGSSLAEIESGIAKYVRVVPNNIAYPTKNHRV